MIQKFITRWEQRKDRARAVFAAAHPASYKEVVNTVLSVLADPEEFDWPDASKVTEIDHGHYQGTLLYVVPEYGYQPDTFWAVAVDYGSCSGCDTLQRISEYSDDPPTDTQVDAYMQLALDVVRGFKQISGYSYDETCEDITARQIAAETPAVVPQTAVGTVSLPLTPLEFGVVVALAGIGLSAMTNNVEVAKPYPAMLNTPETEPVALSAFQTLLDALAQQGAA